ncbi:hypothetical protein SXCC_03484 [Gluconacetobacter sp. SXCC-1]|nr:hypothetical protein SXCC_03484 [Gluconacetobacter sp. SXCC-1]
MALFKCLFDTTYQSLPGELPVIVRVRQTLDSLFQSEREDFRDKRRLIRKTRVKTGFFQSDARREILHGGTIITVLPKQLTGLHHDITQRRLHFSLYTRPVGSFYKLA